MQLDPRLQAVADHIFLALPDLLDAQLHGDDDTRHQARAAIQALWEQLSPDDYRALVAWVNHCNDARADRVLTALEQHPHLDELSPDDRDRAVAAVLWATYPRALH